MGDHLQNYAARSVAWSLDEGLARRSRRQAREKCVGRTPILEGSSSRYRLVRKGRCRWLPRRKHAFVPHPRDCGRRERAEGHPRNFPAHSAARGVAREGVRRDEERCRHHAVPREGIGRPQPRPIMNRDCPICETRQTSTSICAECAYEISEEKHAAEKLPDPDGTLTAEQIAELKVIVFSENKQIHSPGS